MAFFSWCRLLALEQKLKFGEFGKYNWYRCLCLKRNAMTSEEKLRIAREVLDGPSVNTMAAQANETYLRRHQRSHEQASELGKVQPTLEQNQQPSKASPSSPAGNT
jgi:hypothetical protein